MLKSFQEFCLKPWRSAKLDGEWHVENLRETRLRVVRRAKRLGRIPLWLRNVLGRERGYTLPEERWRQSAPAFERAQHHTESKQNHTRQREKEEELPSQKAG